MSRIQKTQWWHQQVRCKLAPEQPATETGSYDPLCRYHEFSWEARLEEVLFHVHKEAAEGTGSKA